MSRTFDCPDVLTNVLDQLAKLWRVAHFHTASGVDLGRQSRRDLSCELSELGQAGRLSVVRLRLSRLRQPGHWRRPSQHHDHQGGPMAAPTRSSLAYWNTRTARCRSSKGAARGFKRRSLTTQRRDQQACPPASAPSTRGQMDAPGAPPKPGAAQAGADSSMLGGEAAPRPHPSPLLGPLPKSAPDNPDQKHQRRLIASGPTEQHQGQGEARCQGHRVAHGRDKLSGAPGSGDSSA